MGVKTEECDDDNTGIEHCLSQKKKGDNSLKHISLVSSFFKIILASKMC